MIVLDTIEQELIAQKTAIIGGLYANSAIAESEDGNERLRDAVENVEEEFNSMVAELYDPQRKDPMKFSEAEEIDWEDNQFFKSTKRQMENAELIADEYDSDTLRQMDRRAAR